MGKSITKKGRRPAEAYALALARADSSVLAAPTDRVGVHKIGTAVTGYPPSRGRRLYFSAYEVHLTDGIIARPATNGKEKRDETL